MSQTLNDLPVGALVKDVNTTYNNAPIIWRVLEHGHTGDPEGSTALEARDILTLKCFDAAEWDGPNVDRQSYGNNRYLYSNLLQWLNSDAAAGEWYTAQHQYDNAPTTKGTDTNNNAYTNKAGFLNGFSTDLKNAMQTVSKTTVKNTVTDGGGSESVASKVFLLSTTEVGLANENNIAEGTIYAYYSADNTDNRRKKYPTAEAVSESDYSSANFNTSSAWNWWLRTPHSGYSHYARSVDTDGSLSGYTAFSGHRGVSPAFCISSSTMVSDTVDEDGAYTLIFGVTPTVTTKYVTKENMTPILNKINNTVRTKIGDLDTRVTALENGGGGGGGGTSNPDGVTDIVRDASGNITQTVFTYSGGVKTTTFSESGGTKTIVERDVKTGASTATVVTVTITDNRVVQVTTIESIE